MEQLEQSGMNYVNSMVQIQIQSVDHTKGQKKL